MLYNEVDEIGVGSFQNSVPKDMSNNQQITLVITKQRSRLSKKVEEKEIEHIKSRGKFRFNRAEDIVMLDIMKKLK